MLRIPGYSNFIRPSESCCRHCSIQMIEIARLCYLPPVFLEIPKIILFVFALRAEPSK